MNKARTYNPDRNNLGFSAISKNRGTTLKSKLVSALIALSALFLATYIFTRDAILSLVLDSMIISVYYYQIKYKSEKLKDKPYTELKPPKSDLIQDFDFTEPEHFGFATSETRILKRVDPKTAKEMACKAPHFYIRDYIPKYWGIEDDFSELILWFKNISGLSSKAKRDLIDDFVDKLIDIIVKNSIKPDVVIPIPPSQAYKISEGLKLLAEELSIRLNAENYTGALERIVTVRKSSTSIGLERPKFEEHYESFDVNQIFDLTGKRVLLIDDVYTLGNTSRAAAAKLFEAGAKEIWILTLAKTRELV
jgi:phosphoribosylpyrophosphate synthetase